MNISPTKARPRPLRLSGDLAPQLQEMVSESTTKKSGDQSADTSPTSQESVSSDLNFFAIARVKVALYGNLL